MSFTEKIENQIHIQVEGGSDLTAAKDLLVVLRQGKTALEYTPHVVSHRELCVIIPYADAIQLCDNVSVAVQLMGTDGDGVPFASHVYQDKVRELIREGGYGGTDN